MTGSNKVFLRLLALLACCAWVTCGSKGGPPPRTIKPQEVDAILKNERLFRLYLNCLLADNNKSCNKDGLELKRALPGALATGCSKCTQNQRVLTERIVKHLMEKRPRDWDKLKNKFDPDHEYEKRYENMLPGKNKTAPAASKKTRGA